MLPGSDGLLHVAGVYFVTPAGGEIGRDIVRRFDFTVPIADQEPGTIAKAQSLAVTELARRIAQLG